MGAAGNMPNANIYFLDNIFMQHSAMNKTIKIIFKENHVFIRNKKNKSPQTELNRKRISSTNLVVTLKHNTLGSTLSLCLH